MPCGIGGTIQNRSFGDFDISNAMTLFYSLANRGTHAWGYTDSRTMEKAPGSILEITSKKEDEIWNELFGKNMFMCHTRLATTGPWNINANNHPFVLGNFVMAHNGYFSGADDQTEIREKSGVETDSFWFLYHVYEEFKVCKDVFKSIDRATEHIFGGTLAIWLLDLRDYNTYIFRANTPATPLHYKVLEDGIVFGSEMFHVVNYLESAGLDESVSFLPGGSCFRINSQGKIVEKRKSENLKNFGSVSLYDNKVLGKYQKPRTRGKVQAR